MSHAKDHNFCISLVQLFAALEDERDMKRDLLTQVRLGDVPISAASLSPSVATQVCVCVFCQPGKLRA